MIFFNDQQVHFVTFTGRRFYPLNPIAGDVELMDIAHALSHLCRFTGHTRAFYSVAEHSVRVSKIVPPEHALWGLLHDASEAYLQDLPRPLKQWGLFGLIYRLAEHRVMRAVRERFCLLGDQPKAVTWADRVLLRTEQRDLMGRQPQPWADGVSPLNETIVPWSAGRAKRAFIKRFTELTTGKENGDVAEALPDLRTRVA